MSVFRHPEPSPEDAIVQRKEVLHRPSALAVKRLAEEQSRREDLGAKSRENRHDQREYQICVFQREFQRVLFFPHLNSFRKDKGKAKRSSLTARTKDGHHLSWQDTPTNAVKDNLVFIVS